MLTPRDFAGVFKLRILGILFGFILVLPLISAEKVVLQLKWDHEFQFAGYYAAQWQGYYKREGFDVEIRPRVTPTGSLLDVGEELRSGRVDYAVCGPDLLIYRDQGIPVVILATIFQHSPYAFVMLKNRFTSPVQLQGKRINQTEPTWGPVEFAAVMRAVGGDPGTMVVDSRPPDLNLLIRNEVDVIATYLTSATWQMKEIGHEFDTFTASEFGVHLYGDTLVTLEQLAEKRPDQVKRFVRASLDGWKYALENTDEIALRIATELPRTFRFYNDFAAYNRHEANDIIKLTGYPDVSIGYSSSDRWAKTLEYFRREGHIRNGIDVDRLIFDPSRRAL